MKTALEFYGDRNDDHSFSECFDYQENLSLGLALMEDYADYVSNWIPIEDFELKDGGVYDIYSPDFGRVVEYIFKSDGRERFVSLGAMEWVIEKDEVTHVMNVPNKPEQ